MAGKNKNVDVNVNVRDRTKAGLQKTKRNIEQATKQISKSTSAMVSEQTGRRLNQFNERTEKMRQVLMLSGNAAGTAAGQVTYYAGTLSYLVGKLGPVEWALMGVGGALALLGATLLKETEAEKAWRESLEAHKKSLKETEEATISLRATEERRMLGLDSDRAYLEYKVRKEWEAAEKTYQIQANAIEEAKRLVDAGQMKMTASEMAAQIKRRHILKQHVEEQKAAYDKLREAGKAYFDWEVRQAEIANLEEEAARSAKGPGGGAADIAGGGIGSIGWGITQKIEGFMGMIVPAGFGDKILQQMSDTARFMSMQDMVNRQQEVAAERYLQMRWREGEQAIRIMEKTAAREQQIQSRRYGALQNNLRLAGQLGEKLAASEDARAKAHIAAEILMSGVDAVREFAKAFGSLDEPWVAAGHFTSAILHSAIAMMSVGDFAKGSKGGGSGGSGIGGGGGFGGGGSWGGGGGTERTEKETAKYIIYVNGHQINTSPDFNRVFAEGSDAWRDSQNPGASKDRF